MLTESQKQIIICSAAFAWIASQLALHKHVGMKKEIAIPVMSALACKAALGDLNSGWSLSQSDMEFWIMSMGTSWLVIKFL